VIGPWTPFPAALVVALTAGAACAHAPAAPPAGDAHPPAIGGSPPGSTPGVRLVASYPDPAARPRVPLWRRILEAIAGVDDRSRGTGDALVRPFGVAASSQGAVIVADPDGQAVVNVAGGGEVPVLCRGLAWDAPMAAAFAPGGALYVVDAGAARVVRVGPGDACEVLPDAGLERPTGIAVLRDRLFVVDTPRHEVVVLSMGGVPIGRFGSRGSEAGFLNFPTAIAASGDRLLVVDALNFRIASFAPDGTWLGSFGTPGDEGGAFARPKAIGVDAAGRLYVSDAQRDAVLVFERDGSFVRAIGEAQPGTSPLAMPAGVAASGNRLYVADSLNHRVAVFELPGGAP
jgi:DNA-binding beta-propeller fold protein YncE